MLMIRPWVDFRLFLVFVVVTSTTTTLTLTLTTRVEAVKPILQFGFSQIYPLGALGWQYNLTNGGAARDAWENVVTTALAVDQINAEGTLLPNYTLAYQFADSEFEQT